MRQLKLTKSAPFHVCVSLAFMLLFRFLPPFGSITPYGMTILGIFLGTIYGWIFSDTMWPTFLSLLVLVLTTGTYSSASEILSVILQDATIGSIIALQFLAAIVINSGAADWIGRWFLSRPVIKGRPILMIAFIFLAGLIITPFTTTAWILFMNDFVDKINTDLGYQRKSRFSQILLYCIMFNSMAAIYLPTQPLLFLPLAIAVRYLPDYTLGVYPMILLGLVLSVCLAAFNFIGLKLVFRLNLSKLRDKNAIKNISSPPPMSKKQKVVISMVLSYLCLIILSCTLPGTWGVTIVLKSLGNVGLCLIAVVLSIVIHVDGKPVATFQEICRHVNWVIVFMPGTAFILAGLLSSEATGVTALLSSLTTQFFSDFSPHLFTLLILIAAMVLTNVINNLVVFSLFVPLIASCAPILGLNVYAIIPLLIGAVNIAIMFPSATQMAALLHANTRQMESNQIIRFSLVSIVTSSIVYAVIGIPLANLLY